MKIPTKQEIAQMAIELCRDELKVRLMTFKATPLGKVTAKVGKRIIEAHNNGRKLDEDDIVEVCQEFGTVIMTEDDFD